MGLNKQFVDELPEEMPAGVGTQVTGVGRVVNRRQGCRDECSERMSLRVAERVWWFIGNGGGVCGKLF